MNIWFTGDQHYYHSQILYYENRPFSRLPHSQYPDHEESLIENHNRFVGEDDICYHLGDLSFLTGSKVNKLEKIVPRLNGRNVLILGNHDEAKPFTYVKFGFESVHTSLILPFDNRFILCHDPACSIVDKESTWIVGHVHGLFTIQGHCINVGVDVWNYEPVHFDTIKSLMLGE